MRLGIDAYGLHHPFNGIGQVTAQLLRAFEQVSQYGAKSDCPAPPSIGPLSKTALARLTAQVGTEFEFFLYMAEDSEAVFPDHFHKRVIRPKFPKRVLSKKWWEMRQLPQAVLADRCDVLISLYQSAAVMSRGFPHILIVHDIIYALSPRFKDTFERKLSLWLTLRGIKRASRCIAVSEYTKQDMVRHLGMQSDGISVAHVAANPEFAVVLKPDQVEQVLQKHHLLAGYIYHGGGLDGRKNAAGVMKAYAILVEQTRTKQLASLPQLVISGKLMPGVPHATDVEALAKKLGISDRVVLLGCVPQADLPALYKGAAVFVYPSHYEGFGLPLLEAMHQAVPVVTANTSSLPEVGGDAVLYCDPNRPEEMAAAIRRILTDAAMRATLAERGLHRAKTFTWDALVFKLMETAVALSKRQQGTLG